MRYALGMGGDRKRMNIVYYNGDCLLCWIDSA